MGGGLMQLTAYGYQDIYLTGKPQITFFKLIYKRHTHFTMDTLNLTINNADFGKKTTIIIPKAGDLIYKCFLKISIPSVSGTNINYYEEPAHHMIKSIEVQIGDTIIDKHFNVWFSIWNALSLPKSKEFNHNKLIGNFNGKNQLSLTKINQSTLNSYIFYLPLQFWFCRFINLALPCSVIKYQDIRFNIEFNTLNNIIKNSSSISPSISITEASIDIDYIYLDTDERYRFFNQSHEYLIEQLQFNGKESLINQKNIIQLDFKNPIKEIIWVSTNNNSTHQLDFRESSSSNKNPTDTAKILLNDNEIFSTKNGRYFSEIQPYQHHTNIPHNSPILYSREIEAGYYIYGDNQYTKYECLFFCIISRTNTTIWFL